MTEVRGTWSSQGAGVAKVERAQQGTPVTRVFCRKLAFKRWRVGILYIMILEFRY